MFEITIPGTPIAMQRHRSFIRAGKIHQFNPQVKIKKRLQLYIKNINPVEEPLQNAINLTLDFFIKRPASHYRSGKFSQLLKKNTPFYAVLKPDIDNYIKFYLDVFNGILYLDDSQVISLIAHKHYCYLIEDERTEVWFTSNEID